MKAGRIFFHNLTNLKRLINECHFLRPTFNYIKKRQEFLFSKHLLATNLTISIGFSALGDIVEQIIELVSKEIKQWDRIRTLKLSTTGFTVGIVCHYWYTLLEKYYPHNRRGQVFKKILLNQIILSPLCILIFFTTLTIMGADGKQRLAYDLTTKGRDIFIAELFIWPPASLINFYFVPYKFRVLYDSITSLGFDIYNSYVVHKKIC
ncbi:Mpv17 2 [Brachionus plicatilis]|uniref:Mpv17 2 n=1 Tax=Brachionus plicatilis TaxID=10195 RepID=A0A3M7T8J6_BRAPC|nr:Mpv17 2 [Brachionus plicatilis]